MLRVEEALEIVAAAAGAPRRRTETVPLARALGRVLARDVTLDHDAPPFDRATMDGFAVRAADAVRGAVLRVVARVHAGAGAPSPVGAGDAVAIMTGAALPEGADAVVPVERTEPAEGRAGAEVRVRVLEPAAPGRHVARRGEQAARGSVVAPEGSRVHAGTVGALAAAGRLEVAVAARPRVAVLGTGDEIVPASRVPGPWQIRDSNAHALAAQVARAGGEAEHLGPVPDDEEALAAAVERGLGADLLCLSGGVSLGDKDLVPAVLAGRGVERLFHRWAVKPGGPLWAGRRGDTLVFGLPGNPAATYVGFEVLVVPALRTRLGLPFAPRRTVGARFEGGPLPAPTARRQYVPVALSATASGLVARGVGSTGSGDPFALARGDALAVVPEEGSSRAAHGPLVEVIPLAEPWEASP